VVTLVFVPVVLLTIAATRGPTAGLLLAWAVFGVAFIGGRAVVLLRRARGTTWMRTGAGR
jgi:hypothetical protein